MLENAVIIVNKPKNITSHDVVKYIKNELNLKKVGHTGTLDPIATGVLVILTGKCTKLSNVFTSYYKEYIAKVKLGILTDTLDITGNVLKEEKVKIEKEKLEEILKNFIGKYTQTVPIYSAVKINGEKLYNYARKNKNVELPKREVTIKEIKLLDFNEKGFTFKVTVSKGTYIRSLINDICKKLNTIGTMEELIRTKQGEYKIEDSYTLEDIKTKNFKFLTLESLFKVYPEINITKNEYNRVKNGNILNKNTDKDYCRIIYNNKLIAIYKKEKNIIKPLINLGGFDE